MQQLKSMQTGCCILLYCDPGAQGHTTLHVCFQWCGHRKDDGILEF